MRKKNRKGTTVVEVVVAFAMISLCVGMGMIGISSGAKYLNAGAKLKKERSDITSMSETGSATVKIAKSGSSTEYTVDVKTYESGDFKRYEWATP